MRHEEGMPSFILYFDEQGNEVPSEVVSAASPTRMQGQLETYTPRPGTGYYAHIRLEGSQAHFQNGQQHTFEIATPTARISATYHQPLTGSAFIKHSPVQADQKSLDFLGRIANRV